MGHFPVVDNNGEKFSHFPDRTGLYATLCGLDGDDGDKSVNQSMQGAAKRVTCPDCIALFDEISKYREADLDRSPIND